MLMVNSPARPVVKFMSEILIHGDGTTLVSIVLHVEGMDPGAVMILWEPLIDAMLSEL